MLCVCNWKVMWLHGVREVELAEVWHTEKVNSCLKEVSFSLGQTSSPSSVEGAQWPIGLWRNNIILRNQCSSLLLTLTIQKQKYLLLLQWCKLNSETDTKHISTLWLQVSNPLSRNCSCICGGNLPDSLGLFQVTLIYLTQHHQFLSLLDDK